MPSLITSSVAKKLGMAVTGLLLYGFLLGHLSGNFLLLKQDGGVAFNAYSDFLINHPLLLPVEIGLVIVFVLHVYLAIAVSRENRKARPIGYHVSAAVGGRSWASRTMIWSGLLILVFLVLHLINFKYGDRGTGTLYDLVEETFHKPFYVIGYLLALTVLGFHLWHAFQSAFQTLGLHTRSYIRRASILLCLLISGGFAVIPVWFFWEAVN